MKKLTILFVLLLILTGCKKTNALAVPFDIETYNTDVSYYEGLTNEDSMFLGTTIKEIKRTIDENGHGVFVIGFRECSHCQIAMQYLNQVAKELDVHVYYIDAMSKEYPILDTEDFDIMNEILYDYYREDEDGTRELQTPHVFSIIDGKISESYIGTPWKGSNYNDDDINKLLDIYRKILKPFSSQSQD